MAINRGRVVGIICLQISLLSCVLATTFPNFDVVRTGAAYLGGELQSLMKSVSGYDDLQEAYDDNSADMQFTAIDGDEMARTLSQALGQILDAKMVALQKSVDWAEKVAQKYKWDDSLEIGDVPYVAAKQINESDPDFEYSEQFQQKVNWNSSSVHIPVEIYEGDINILNGLAWTDQLDKVWKENREEDDKLLWQYFGSQTGIMRNYPASKWREDGVDLYDVRRRPWYTQGASSPKDMLILIDTSGSTHGQALSLMKQAVDSLLDTLGENDFVNAAYFSDTAQWVGCFQTFVQATFRNKKQLRKHVDDLSAKGMASYTKGLEFAFQEFEKFEERENSTEGIGAACNRIIMFLTDGGTERPEEVFKQYNWPEMEVRIFAYAVGPTANPIAAVRWIACANRGYFYRIPAMGAIRSTVQEHVSVVARPMALSLVPYIQWSNIYSDALSIRKDLPGKAYYEILGKALVGEQREDFHMTSIFNDPRDYISVLGRPKCLARDKQFSWSSSRLDPMGLGMMTTVTLPVYNRTNDVYNQTILGVMGSDVTVSEMVDHIPHRKLGANGYAFAINNNGYIVFHPNLKATNGWLQEPPNVDFLDVEYETQDKVELRKKMINREEGREDITTYIYLPDERHLDNRTRHYYYQPLPNSNFTIGVVIPDYVRYYVESVTAMDVSEGVDYLSKDATEMLVAPWEFCANVISISNESTPLQDLIYQIENNHAACDDALLQALFFDAKVTETMDTVWTTSLQEGFVATFVGTNAGLTKVYPPSEGYLMEGLTDVWTTMYYKRALDNPDKWMFSAPYQQRETRDPNATAPLITATKSVIINDEYRPAVAGVIVNQTKLRSVLLEELPDCASHVCYLVDDGGFLIVSSSEEDDMKVGKFLGDFEPHLMSRLVNMTVYLQHIQYDLQAACPSKQEIYSAGPRTATVPVVFEMLTLNWWTSKIAWFYLNFNLYEWFIAPVYNFVAAQTSPNIVTDEDGKQYRLQDSNYSCIKSLAQYTISELDVDLKADVECGNCTRTFASAKILGTNLLVVMVDPDCHGTCTVEPLPQEPVESDDPAFLLEDGNTVCPVEERYRQRPACYDYNKEEDYSDCGRGAQFRLSLSALLVHLATISVAMLCLSRS